MKPPAEHPPARSLETGGIPWLAGQGAAQLLPWLLAIFLISIIGLMVWTHQRWEDTVSAMVSQDDLLATARTQVAEAEVLTERWLAGDVSARPEMVLAKLDRAATAGDDLIAGNAARMGHGEARIEHGGDLLQQARAYRQAIGDIREQMLHELGQTRAPAFVVDLRQSHARLSEAAVAVERALDRESRARLREQTGLAAAGIVLLTALTTSLYAWLYSVERRRERALRALLASESRNRAFIETVPELAFLIDASGRVNEVFASKPGLLMIPRHMVVGRQLHEFLPPELAADYLRVIRQALAEGRTLHYEYELGVQEGQRVFEARVAAVPEAGEAVWACWDVTQRHQDAQRLTHLTRMYAFLSQVNRTIAWEREREGFLRRLSERALAHGGFVAAWIGWWDTPAGPCQPVSFDARPEREALAPSILAVADRAESWIDRVRRSGLASYGEALQDGDLPGASSAALDGLRGRVALPLAIDGQVQGVLVLLTDRADLQSAQERQLLAEIGASLSRALSDIEHETRHRAVEAGMRLHAAALASTRDGVMMLDESLRIVFVNQAFSEITGRSPGESIGQRVDGLGFGPTLDPASPAWTEVAVAGSWQGEVDGLRSSGEAYTLWMSISAVGGAPATEGGGPPLGPEAAKRHKVVVFTDVSHLRLAETRLERIAHFDPLTDLPNRSQVLLRLGHTLERARRVGEGLAIFYIDLDHFKNVNDSLGHTAGDALLAAVAERLRGIAPRHAVLGRMGGDEFLLAVSPCPDSHHAVGVAQSVLDTLKAPLRMPDGRELYMQASIGVSQFPQDGDDAGDLIRDADTALYQAKAAGRNTYRFYIGALTQAVTARLEMETRLRRALDHEEFELWYQPLVRLSDGALLGVEALVRLRAGDGAVVNPAAFIPLMEETGLIVALGDWVRGEACRQAAAWRAAGFAFGSVAVNVSPVEIARGGLAERLRRNLQEHALPPACLEIEITESGLMEHGERAEALVAGLAALGVRVSLDDFGTGYSSLAYLKRFKVDKLKIDRSFIRDLPTDAQDAKLVGAIVAMGHSLDLDILAEGVETEDQAEFLRMRGCHAAQGYLYSVPLDAGSLFERYGPARTAAPMPQTQTGGEAPA